MNSQGHLCPLSPPMGWSERNRSSHPSLDQKTKKNEKFPPAFLLIF
jgi:hypothetical protein